MWTNKSYFTPIFYVWLEKASCYEIVPSQWALIQYLFYLYYNNRTYLIFQIKIQRLKSLWSLFCCNFYLIIYYYFHYYHVILFYLQYDWFDRESRASGIANKSNRFNRSGRPILNRRNGIVGEEFGTKR